MGGSWCSRSRSRTKPGDAPADGGVAGQPGQGPAAEAGAEGIKAKWAAVRNRSGVAGIRRDADVAVVLLDDELTHNVRLSCRNNAHRPHRGISNARPLTQLPAPITDTDQFARLDIRRRDRLGGILHEYEQAA
jgi:hypothetical protein